MPTAPRSTRRAAAQQALNKENQASSTPPLASEDTTAASTTPSSKKARHRVSATELVRLEDVFSQNTHPSREQKNNLAAELGMDYKTVTIWFQNRRQTSKKGQPPAEGSVARLGRTRANSSLRSVSSPSRNATLLDASENKVDPRLDASESENQGLNVTASRQNVKSKPLLDSLNVSPLRAGEHASAVKVTDNCPQSASECEIASTDSSRDDQIPQQKEKPIRWKRVRTLEWACERQTKRRKLSKEGHVRLGSEELEDHEDLDDARMDSVFTLLSLASSAHMEPTTDVMMGASLLLSFKHAWCRK